MPPLTNARHERFVHELAQGKTAEKAYVDAGYKANRHNAAALAREQHISTRLQELQEKAAEVALVSIQSLTDELEEARAIAIAEKQSSAAVAATLGKAKLHGLLVEKKQHAGPGGGPIKIADLSRLKGMTTEELKTLDRALVQIGIADGDTEGTGEQEE